MKTNEKGEPFGHSGETAASIMSSMNKFVHHLRDEELECIEDAKGYHGGACDKENFQSRWSNVRYSRYVAAGQDKYDRIFHDHEADLVDDAIRPKQAMPLRDALVQTQALMEGVVKIATELNAAGHHYKTRNSSETWSGIILRDARWHRRVDHG
jgi:hypothetical protein